MAEAHSPQVFISFAGTDRAMADRLRRDLQERDIEVSDFPLGQNLVLDINQKLAQSDYFVLLWSQAAVDRQWVSAEWSAAFARELLERRSFLFVVRLDRTPLPALLAARHYLDAADNNWNELVNELVGTWRRDRAVGEPVLPAPCQETTANGAGGRQNIVLYIRNRALSVAHVMAVPEESTGRQLMDLVRTALALTDITERFDGAVGMRFKYQLEHVFGVISDDTRKLAKLHVADGDTIDLVVFIEPFGPEGKFPVTTYRKSSPTNLSPVTTRSLIDYAFNHLIPW
jgi:hypothetical protein